MSNSFSKYSSLLTVVGILFIIWSILGMMDAKNFTYSGYQTGDNFDVIKVDADSPAEAAGMMVGDVIKSTGGIAVTDTKALRARGRAKIGETRKFVVEREGAETSYDLTFAAQSSKDKTLNSVGDAIGLLFIFIGLFSYRLHKTSLSFAFAVFAICFGFIFTNGPYIDQAGLRIFVNILSTAVVLFSFTALLSFILKYPPESSFLSKSSNRKLLYAPMVLILGIIVILEIMQADNSGTINMVMRLLFGAFVIVYFGGSLITLLKKYGKASSEDRRGSGLNLMMIGTVVGLLPILIYFTIGLVKPGIELPGNDYVFITFAAIPVFFSMGLKKLYSS